MNIAAVVFVVTLAWLSSTGNTMLSDIFHLTGSILKLLNRLIGQKTPADDSMSSGRRTKEEACTGSSKPSDKGTNIVGCSLCDRTKNGEAANLLEKKCAQACKLNKCAIYQNDNCAGCLKSGGLTDNCSCGKPAFGADYLIFVVSRSVDRKKARDTPAGNCTSA
ncbi:hypothetical protein HDE_03868 [Halotydeus destructor]|nr:hypothetical protein HDE_03868 [Halotydeus destructor]